MAGLDFTHVHTWVFDLDNTLYQADGMVFAQVDRRMGEFIRDFLDVPMDEARRLQKLYYYEYGTTLSGLMSVHGLDPEPFLTYVHDIDVSSLGADARLDAALTRLPGRKVIYTNGSVSHAENVLGRLQLTEHFSDIYDIAAAEFVPKPHIKAYEHICRTGGILPANAAMFEDIARNLEAAHVLGMTTVWVRGGVDWSKTQDETAPSAPPDASNHPHVHHTTRDLAGFLDAVTVHE